MNRRREARLLVALAVVQVVGFAVVAALVWLDEELDLPARLLGAVPTPRRPEEVALEVAGVALLGLLVLLTSGWMARRLLRVESYLHLCAWCRRVEGDTGWVSLERYVADEHGTQPSHGLCPECAKRMVAPGEPERPGR
jgi:hypothetical protein